jgi:hypothetical protein
MGAAAFSVIEKQRSSNAKTGSSILSIDQDVVARRMLAKSGRPSLRSDDSEDYEDLLSDDCDDLLEDADFLSEDDDESFGLDRMDLFGARAVWSRVENSSKLQGSNTKGGYGHDITDFASPPSDSAFARLVRTDDPGLDEMDDILLGLFDDGPGVDRQTEPADPRPRQAQFAGELFQKDLDKQMGRTQKRFQRATTAGKAGRALDLKNVYLEQLRRSQEIEGLGDIDTEPGIYEGRTPGIPAAYQTNREFVESSIGMPASAPMPLQPRIRVSKIDPADIARPSDINFEAPDSILVEPKNVRVTNATEPPVGESRESVGKDSFGKSWWY